jgi:undecaprenyl-diphosphatase
VSIAGFLCALAVLNLDRAICAFVNRAAQHWEWLDQTNVFISNSDLVKGGVVLAFFWAMWFRRPSARAGLLAGLGGSLVALAIARVLAGVLPVRQRPLLDPGMHFVPPLGLPDQSNWTNWSSFPSDHAALFFAIVAGIWLADRRAAWFAAAYTLIAICLPRLYVGIHYPTDIIAGALIGVGAVALLSQSRERWASPIVALLDRYPGWGYALFFLLTFQIATLFWDVRVILSYLGFST